MIVSGLGTTVRSPIIGLGCLIAGVTLTGCASILQGEPDPGGGGGGPSSAPYAHATGAADVLVSIDVAGGYTSLEFSLRDTADFLLLGNGTAIVPGAVIEIFPGPAIYPLQSATVPEGRIQELFAAAAAAGLLVDTEIDYGDPGVIDVPDTSVQLTVDGRTYSHSAYALGYEDDSSPSLSEANRAARSALRGFIDTAQAMVGVDSEQYVPDAVAAFRVSTGEPLPLEPELEQEPQPWPIATVPPPIAPSYPTSCVVITGAETVQLLAALEVSNELTPWLIGTEPPTRMAFRPLLPDDPGCEQ